MEDRVHPSQGRPQHHAVLYRAHLLITQSPPLVSEELDSGQSMAATPTAATARSEIRCSTGPTHQEDVPLEDVHHQSILCLRLHGDASLEPDATLRTQQHGLTRHKWTDGPSHTSLLPSVTRHDVTVSVTSVDSLEWTPPALTWPAVQRTKTSRITASLGPSTLAGKRSP